MAKNRKTPDMNLPMWFDGQNINEALFCEEFLQERRIIFANGAFFTPDGRVTDDLPLRGEIYDKLKFCAVNNIPRKITNILEVLKLEAQVPDFPPEQDRIHLSNGTLLLNGTFTEGRPAIVRSRLPVAYNPDATAPVIWLNFLDGLLYAEDIPTLQEFIGYCLIPSNKGQRMMVIKGNGGEGKSQIGAVLSTIFGTNMKDGSIGKISENRFARADLEHILLCVDDDMRMEALRQTNYQYHCLAYAFDGSALRIKVALINTSYVETYTLRPTVAGDSATAIHPQLTCSWQPNVTYLPPAPDNTWHFTATRKPE